MVDGIPSTNNKFDDSHLILDMGPLVSFQSKTSFRDISRRKTEET